MLSFKCSFYEFLSFKSQIQILSFLLFSETSQNKILYHKTSEIKWCSRLLKQKFYPVNSGWKSKLWSSNTKTQIIQSFYHTEVKFSHVSLARLSGTVNRQQFVVELRSFVWFELQTSSRCRPGVCPSGCHLVLVGLFVLETAAAACWWRWRMIKVLDSSPEERHSRRRTLTLSFLLSENYLIGGEISLTLCLITEVRSLDGGFPLTSAQVRLRPAITGVCCVPECHTSEGHMTNHYYLNTLN